MKYTKEQINEAREQILKELKPGDKLYTILRQVSRSGMSRHISVIRADNGIRDITYLVARVLEMRRDEHDGGIVISGAGMDMGFEIVYLLGRALWSEGFAPSTIGIRPQDRKSVNVDIGRGHNAGPMTKAEINDLASNGWKFIGGRNGDTSGWDTDGGYALKQEWI